MRSEQLSEANAIFLRPKHLFNRSSPSDVSRKTCHPPAAACTMETSVSEPDIRIDVLPHLRPEPRCARIGAIASVGARTESTVLEQDNHGRDDCRQTRTSSRVLKAKGPISDKHLDLACFSQPSSHPSESPRGSLSVIQYLH